MRTHTVDSVRCTFLSQPGFECSRDRVGIRWAGGWKPAFRQAALPLPGAACIHHDNSGWLRQVCHRKWPRRPGRHPVSSFAVLSFPRYRVVWYLVVWRPSTWWVVGGVPEKRVFSYRRRQFWGRFLSRTGGRAYGVLRAGTGVRVVTLRMGLSWCRGMCRAVTALSGTGSPPDRLGLLVPYPRR